MRARRVPADWRGDADEGRHAGGELRATGWTFHLDDDGPAQPAPRFTPGGARWAPPALKLDAAAPFGGFLVSPGVRLLAAAEKRVGEGAP